MSIRAVMFRGRVVRRPPERRRGCRRLKRGVPTHAGSTRQRGPPRAPPGDHGPARRGASAGVGSVGSTPPGDLIGRRLTCAHRQKRSVRPCQQPSRRPALVGRGKCRSRRGPRCDSRSDSRWSRSRQWRSARSAVAWPCDGRFLTAARRPLAPRRVRSPGATPLGQSRSSARRDETRRGRKGRLTFRRQRPVGGLDVRRSTFDVRRPGA